VPRFCLELRVAATMAQIVQAEHSQQAKIFSRTRTYRHKPKPLPQHLRRRDKRRVKQLHERQLNRHRSKAALRTPVSL